MIKQLGKILTRNLLLIRVHKPYPTCTGISDQNGKNIYMYVAIFSDHKLLKNHALGATLSIYIHVHIVYIREYVFPLQGNSATEPLKS